MFGWLWVCYPDCFLLSMLRFLLFLPFVMPHATALCHSSSKLCWPAVPRSPCNAKLALPLAWRTHVYMPVEGCFWQLCSVVTARRVDLHAWTKSVAALTFPPFPFECCGNVSKTLKYERTFEIVERAVMLAAVLVFPQNYQQAKGKHVEFSTWPAPFRFLPRRGRFGPRFLLPSPLMLQLCFLLLQTVATDKNRPLSWLFFRGAKQCRN